MSIFSSIQLRAKILIMLFLPMLGMTGFGVSTVLEKRDLAQRMDAMHQLSGLGVRASAVVHEAQKE
ncbi:MAG: hypothetical protein HQL86_07660, partial [Magnetococcales bacterium]|nr:hypothetical protein [Magnetococcales bacterium]